MLCTKKTVPNYKGENTMKTPMFSVYDSKAEAYLPPFLSQNANVAIRSMRQAISDPNHSFCKHAEDYTLFEVGTFDDNTGDVINTEPKKSLGNALTMKHLGEDQDGN